MEKNKRKIIPQKIIFYFFISLFLFFLFLTLFILPDLAVQQITQGPLIEIRKKFVEIITNITFKQQPEVQKWILTVITSLLGLVSGILAVLWRKKLELDKNIKQELEKKNEDEEEKTEIIDIKKLKGFKKYWFMAKPFLFFAFLLGLAWIFPDVLIQIRILVSVTCFFLASFEIIGVLEEKK